MQFQKHHIDLGEQFNKQVLNLYRRTKGQEQPEYFREKKVRGFFSFLLRYREKL